MASADEIPTVEVFEWRGKDGLNSWECVLIVLMEDQSAFFAYANDDLSESDWNAAYEQHRLDFGHYQLDKENNSITLNPKGSFFMDSDGGKDGSPAVLLCDGSKAYQGRWEEVDDTSQIVGGYPKLSEWHGKSGPPAGVFKSIELKDPYGSPEGAKTFLEYFFCNYAVRCGDDATLAMVQFTEKEQIPFEVVPRAAIQEIHRINVLPYSMAYACYQTVMHLAKSKQFQEKVGSNSLAYAEILNCAVQPKAREDVALLVVKTLLSGESENSQKLAEAYRVAFHAGKEVVLKELEKMGGKFIFKDVADVQASIRIGLDGWKPRVLQIALHSEQCTPDAFIAVVAEEHSLLRGTTEKFLYPNACTYLGYGCEHFEANGDIRGGKWEQDIAMWQKRWNDCVQMVFEYARSKFSDEQRNRFLGLQAIANFFKDTLDRSTCSFGYEAVVWMQSFGPPMMESLKTAFEYGVSPFFADSNGWPIIARVARLSINCFQRGSSTLIVLVDTRGTGLELLKLIFSHPDAEKHLPSSLRYIKEDPGRMASKTFCEGHKLHEQTMTEPVAAALKLIEQAKGI